MIAVVEEEQRGLSTVLRRPRLSAYVFAVQLVLAKHFNFAGTKGSDGNQLG